MTYTFTFDKDVKDFTQDDIVVNNGTKGYFTGSGKIYQLEVSNTTSGLQTVSIENGVCTDEEGNENSSASKSTNVDVTSPVISGIKDIKKYTVDNLSTDGTKYVNYIRLENGQIQYGPYDVYNKGVYRVIVEGSNLDKGNHYFNGYQSSYTFNIYDIKVTSNTLEYYVVIPYDNITAEFVLKNPSSSIITITGITTQKLTSYDMTSIPITGNASRSGSMVILGSGGTQYGPYTTLEPGRYTVTVTGLNVNQGSFDAASSDPTGTISTSIDTSVIKSNSYVLQYAINLTSTTSRVEFRMNHNKGFAQNIHITSLSIKKDGNYTLSAPTDAHSGISKWGYVVDTEIPTGLSSVILSGSQTVPVFQSNKMALKTNTTYRVSFDYYCITGAMASANQFEVDLFPDTLPQYNAIATTSAQHTEWTFSSSHSDMNNAMLRFFDGLQESYEADIYIFNIRLYEVGTRKEEFTTAQDYNLTLYKDNVIKIYAYDNAGNYSENSYNIYCEDVPIPSQPSQPDLIASHDTGSSPTDNVTMWWYNITLQGTADPNTTLKLYKNGTYYGETKTDFSGNWSMSVNNNENEYTNWVAYSENIGGMSAPSAPLVIFSDTQAPTQTIVNLNGYASGTTTANNVTQTANATDNWGVAYYQYTNDNVNWVTRPNPWTITWEGNWPVFYARAVDVAGNVGAISSPYSIIINRVYQINHLSGAISYAVTLQEAINVATTNSTIYLLKDTVDGAANSINGKTLIYNSNGRTLTLTNANCGLTVNSNAALVIQGNGTITSSNTNTIITNSGELQVQGSNIIQQADTYTIVNSGLFMAIGGVISNNSPYTTIISMYNGQARDWSSGTISSCTFKCSMHIDKSAVIINYGTGHAIHDWQGTANCSIHLPHVYQGYIYAASGTAIRSHTNSLIKINAGTIYSPTGKFYNGNNIDISTSSNLYLIKGAP